MTEWEDKLVLSLSFLMGSLIGSPCSSELGRTLQNEACDVGLEIFLMTSSYTEEWGRAAFLGHGKRRILVSTTHVGKEEFQL